jgi:hypothetical protein
MYCENCGQDKEMERDDERWELNAALAVLLPRGIPAVTITVTSISQRKLNISGSRSWKAKAEGSIVQFMVKDPEAY